MTPDEIDAAARTFIAAGPKQRVNQLGSLSDEDRMAVVRRTAELGYEPTIKALGMAPATDSPGAM